MNVYHRQTVSHLPSYGTIFEPVVRLYTAWLRRRRFARLRALDDRHLDDIGLTRDEVEWGMRLPLRENAALIVGRQRAASRAARKHRYRGDRLPATDRIA